MNQEPTQAEAKRVEMRPIIFSTPMVQAILAGRKTQTRRIIKSRHESGLFRISRRMTDNVITSIESLDWDERNCEKDIACPYGKAGDILYVRETWVRACLSEDGEGPAKGENWRYWYKADDDWTKHDWDNPNIDGPVASPRWKPSIHMPRAAARIFLKITDISVERLQDITEEDAISEGVQPNTCDDPSKCPSSLKGTGCCGDGEYFNYLNKSCEGEPCYSAVESFETLWKSINGEESWEQSPWVWKITFERIEKPTP